MTGCEQVENFNLLRVLKVAGAPRLLCFATCFERVTDPQELMTAAVIGVSQNRGLSKSSTINHSCHKTTIFGVLNLKNPPDKELKIVSCGR